MKAPFALERLGDEHDRTEFSCGEDALDRYFRTQVTQDVRRRVATCFVAVEAETGVVAGFYTLAAAGVPVSDLPSVIAKKLPRYPTVPAIRVGRLAVDGHFQGRGLGAALLADAATRALRADVAAFLLLVEAKNQNAAFYEKLGFVRLESHARSLFLPLATADKAWLR